MSITKCDSPSALNTELEVVRRKVSIQETGASWDAIEQGIVQLTECCNNGGCAFATEMVAAIRSLSKPLNNAINSERSRLSGSAINLITALSAGLGPAFEPLVSLFISTLIGLCARTNKVFVTRAKACIVAVIKYTQSPSILPYLAESVHHKSASLRLVAAEGVLACLNCFNPPDDTCARLIEDVIKLTSRDASANVRATGRAICEAYKVLPHKSESIAPLTSITEKQDVPALSRGRPTTGRVRSAGPSTRQGALRVPSDPGSSSIQSTKQRRDVAQPVVPTIQRHQRVKNVPAKPRSEGVCVSAGTQRVHIAPPPETTDGAEMMRTARNTRPPSVNPSPIGSLPKSLVSHSTRVPSPRIAQSRSDGPTTKVELQTTSQASRRRVIAPRSGQQTVGQRKPVLEGRAVTKGQPKALSTPSNLGGKDHGSSNPAPEDVSLPPSHTTAVPVAHSPASRLFEPAASGEPHVQATHEHIPRDVSHHCIDHIPSSLPSSTQQREMLFTPSRLSYMDRLQRAPRRPRHISKRPICRERADHRGDSICIDTLPPLCGINNIHPPSEIHSTPLASCIQREPLFTPPSHDAHVRRDVPGRPSDMAYRLRRVPKRPRRISRRTNRDYTSVDATPLPSNVNTQEAVAIAHATNSSTVDEDVPCFTLYQGCELRQVVEGLTDVRLDHATMLFYM